MSRIVKQLKQFLYPYILKKLLTKIGIRTRKNRREQIKEKLMQQGYSYREERNHKKALEIFQQAVQKYPEWMFAYVNTAMGFRNLGQLDETKKYLLQVLERDEINIDALREMGITLHQEGNYKEALEVFKKASQYYPDDSLFYMEVAKEYYFLGKNESALSYFQQAIQKSKEQLHNNLSNGQNITKYLSIVAEYIQFLQNTTELETAEIFLRQSMLEYSHVPNIIEGLCIQLSKLGFLDDAINIIANISNEVTGKTLSNVTRIYFQTPSFKHIARASQSLNRHLQDSESKKIQRGAFQHIFVSAFFRSGSTYFYSLFKSVENISLFYEPLNTSNILYELKQSISSSKHLKWVLGHSFSGAYFEEYKEFKQEHLKVLLLEKFDLARYMNLECPTTTQVSLKFWIDYILQNATFKSCVLQFNRALFMLGWLRENYPNALIVSLERNPRDIYASMLSLDKRQGRRYFHNLSHLNNPWPIDKYLVHIINALNLPLNPYEFNLYEKIYFLNRISNFFAATFSDRVFKYTEVIHDPISIINSLLDLLSSEEQIDIDTSQLIPPKKDRVDTWQEFASDEWFLGYEEKCDNILNQYELFKNPLLN